MTQEFEATGSVRASSSNLEHQFWNSEPRYSVPVPSEPPPRRLPSRSRRVLSRLLFGVLFSAILILLCYEVTMKFGLASKLGLPSNITRALKLER